MAKPKGKIKIRWSPEFAYAIGLLVTDGNLSKDGRHIEFTSKDAELLKHFLHSLKIQSKIRKKTRWTEKIKKYYRVQISDVLFYRFLKTIGLMPNKSHRIGAVDVPDKFFFDFLRGHFDGDGSFYAYYDPRWNSSYLFYTVFTSASPQHIYWLRKKIAGLADISGHVSKAKKQSVYQLRYGKKESLVILDRMYSHKKICLTRKRLKISKALSIIGAHL
jgi:hypothetical protein